MIGLAPGHPLYRRSMAALFLIGISTFGLMYTVQPLLVRIGEEFGQGASQTSLLMSATTAGIALSVIPLGQLSARIGRSNSMRLGLGIATACGLATAVAPTWELLVLARGVMGVGLAFVMVSAMAWVVDQAAPMAVARIGGLYISGSTVGGMTGRLFSGFFAELLDWRMGVLLTSVLAVAGGTLAHLLLPRTDPLARGARKSRRAVADPNRGFRVRMFLVGGFGMATFVGIYNVTGYRVAGEPFGLGPGFTGLLFLTYASGTVTSAIAGQWVVRSSVAKVMLVGSVAAAGGILLTLVDSIAAIVAGLLVLSAGFFTLHTVANAGAAKFSPAPSSSAALYTLGYYVGSSLGAIVLGVAWDAGGWRATVAAALALLACAGIAGATARPVSPPAA